MKPTHLWIIFSKLLTDQSETSFSLYEIQSHVATNILTMLSYFLIESSVYIF